MLEPSKDSLRRLFRQRRDNKDMPGFSFPLAAVSDKLRVFLERLQRIGRNFCHGGFYRMGVVSLPWAPILLGPRRKFSHRTASRNFFHQKNVVLEMLPPRPTVFYP